MALGKLQTPLIQKPKDYSCTACICCCLGIETLTFIFTCCLGNVRPGSATIAPGAFTRWMFCSSSTAASFLSWDFLPFILVYQSATNMSASLPNLDAWEFASGDSSRQCFVVLWAANVWINCPSTKWKIQATNLLSQNLDSRFPRASSIFLIAFSVWSTRSLLYLSGLFLLLSNSNVVSCTGGPHNSHQRISHFVKIRCQSSQFQMRKLKKYHKTQNFIPYKQVKQGIVTHKDKQTSLNWKWKCLSTSWKSKHTSCPFYCLLYCYVP